MAGPFDFLNIGGSAPPGTDPVAAESFKSTNPWLRMFGLGTTPQDAATGRARLVELDEQKIYAEVAAKAAELARTAPDRGQLAQQLLMDPVGMNALTKLPQDKIKSLFDNVLANVKPDQSVYNTPNNTLTFGMQPGGTTPTPIAQGGYESKTQNPFGKDISTTNMPGQTFGPAVQPPTPITPPGAPAPGPQGQMQLPPGMSMAQPTETAAVTPPRVPSAPAAMAPGSQPETWYESVISAEGTGVRGNPYDEVLGYGKWGVPEKPPSQMTLAEVKAHGKKMREAQAKTGVPWEQTSSAMGAFQIVGNTMEDAQRALGLPDSAIFDEQVQRRIADWVAQNQGLDAWEGFKSNPQARVQAEAALGLDPTGGAGTMSVPQSQLETTIYEAPERGGAPAQPTPKDIDTLVRNNKVTMALGSGVAPFFWDMFGRAGRQIDPRMDLAGSKAAALAEYHQRILTQSVMALAEGAKHKSEVDAIRKMVPDFGVGTDPLVTLGQMKQLRQYAESEVSALVRDVNDPNLLGSEAQKDASTRIQSFNRVLRALPETAEMDALEGMIQENPEAVPGLITFTRAMETLSQAPGPVGTIGRAGRKLESTLPTPTPELEGGMTVENVRAMPVEQLQTFMHDLGRGGATQIPLDVLKEINAKLKQARSVQPAR